MWLVVGLLITAVLLMVVSAVLPGLRIDKPGSALIAAVLARVIGMAAGFVLAPALMPYIAAGGWIAYPAYFVIPVVALTIAIAVTPGITVTRAISVPVAAVLVAGLRHGALFGIVVARFAATNPSVGGGPLGF